MAKTYLSWSPSLATVHNLNYFLTDVLTTSLPSLLYITSSACRGNRNAERDQRFCRNEIKSSKVRCLELNPRLPKLKPVQCILLSVQESELTTCRKYGNKSSQHEHSTVRHFHQYIPYNWLRIIPIELWQGRVFCWALNTSSRYCVCQGRNIKEISLQCQSVYCCTLVMRHHFNISNKIIGFNPARHLTCSERHLATNLLMQKYLIVIGNYNWK